MGTNSITRVVETAFFASLLPGVGIRVPVGRIVVPLTAVGRTAVMPFHIGAITPGISRHVGLCISSSTEAESSSSN